MEQKFIEFVAGILEVNPETLSMESSYEDGVWDSLMHIRLVAEIYDEYEVDIPLDEIAEIKTLADFYRYIKEA